MTSGKYLNERQYAFFRGLRRHPNGLPEKHWPRPETWRRWMEQERFRAYFLSTLEGCRSLQSLNGAVAATTAMVALRQKLAEGAHDSIEPLLAVIRRDTASQAAQRKNPRSLAGLLGLLGKPHAGGRG